MVFLEGEGGHLTCQNDRYCCFSFYFLTFFSENRSPLIELSIVSGTISFSTAMFYLENKINSISIPLHLFLLVFVKVIKRLFSNLEICFYINSKSQPSNYFLHYINRKINESGRGKDAEINVIPWVTKVRLFRVIIVFL